MISDSAALVVFAIRSALRLGQQTRQAYVESTQRRDLILPLPNFFSSPDIVSAWNYFKGTDAGKTHVAATPRLQQLLAKPVDRLSADEEAELRNFHTEFFNLDCARHETLQPAADGAWPDVHEFNVLITIRQWKRGTDPNPSVLQRLAGTFLEIGVDYFANVPGALNSSSKQGKVLGGFLDAMSQIPFADLKSEELPARLMVAALETLGEESPLLTSDVKVQKLVSVTTTTLSGTVSQQLALLTQTNLTGRQRLLDWTELVYRSLLSSAGRLVLENPGQYLGIQDDGSDELISSTGDAMLSLVLSGPGAGLDRVFSRAGLEQLAHAALKTVGEHPEILGLSGNTALQKLLGSIAAELGKLPLVSPSLFPELARLILEKSGQNLPLLWPDLARSPEKNLLLTAAGTTLAVLSQTPAAGVPWTPAFTGTDLLTVLESVFDAIIANPAWLESEVEEAGSHLQNVLTALVQVLRSKADPRLSTATAVKLIRTAIEATGKRQELLTASAGKLNPRPLAALILDAVVSRIFSQPANSAAAWQLARNDSLIAITRICFTAIAQVKMPQAKLDNLTRFLNDQIQSLAGGSALDLKTFETNLQLALSTN